MSTTCTHYTIIGFLLDFDEVDYETYEAEIDRTGVAKYDMIYDGCSGEFVVAGHILVQGDIYEGMEFTNVSESMETNKQAIEDKLSRVKKDWPTTKEPSLYSFTHWQ